MRTMKAALLYERETPLVVESLEIEEPQEGEVLVRLAASGVCHSDYSVIHGTLAGAGPGGIILGHEGAGVVEAVGPGVSTLQPDDHVILSWIASCGTCVYCTVGRPNLCVTQRRPAASRVRKGDQRIPGFLGVGSFGEYAVVTEAAAIPIRRDLPLDRAALIGCAVTTGVGAVINTAKVQAGSNVVVIGCGGVGLNAVQGAALAGAGRIIAVDVVPYKIDLAEQFGATHGINAAKEDVVARVRELTGGIGADYAFEVIGLPATIQQAYDCVRRGGMAVVVGAGARDAQVSFSAYTLFASEKTLQGCLYGSARPRVDFPRFADLYLGGKLKLDELISRRFALEEVNAAFKAMERGEVARGVVVYG